MNVFWQGSLPLSLKIHSVFGAGNWPLYIGLEALTDLDWVYSV